MYAEAIFQSVSNAGALSFVSVFLVRLGAASWLVGFLTSLPALVAILFSLPMGSMVQRRGALVRTTNWARFLFRTAIGSFALLPFLPAPIAPYALVGTRGLAAIPDTALNVAQTSMMGQLTTPQRRLRMISTRAAIMGLFSAGMGFLAGQWLDRSPYPFNYQILFLTAFLSGLGSVWVVGQIRLLEAPTDQSARRGRISLKAVLTLIKETAGFRRFTVASFLFRIGMSFPIGLYTLYRVRVLGASDAWLGTLFTVQHLLDVGTYLTLSRLGSRERFRRWLWVGCLGMALYPFTTALCRTPEMLVFPAIIIGVFPR